MDPLSRLTIVIPSYCRPQYLRRQLDFWAGSEASVLVIDGSPTAIGGDVLIPKNVSYAHDPAPFTVRMSNCVHRISTEFVAVLGDDDFFSPSGLRDCITRLDAEKGLVGCVGRSVRFFYQDGRILAEQRDPDSTEFPSTVVNGIDRLMSMYHPGKIGALFYGVYRTTAWSDIVRATYSRSFATGYIYDTVIRTLVTYRGPVGIVESVVWFCSSENPPVKDAPGMDRHVGFLDWLRLPENATEVRECEALMIDDLVQCGSDSHEDVSRAVRFVLDELRRRYEIKEARHDSLAVRVRRVLMRRAPRWLKRLIKRLIPSSMGQVVDWTVVELGVLTGRLVQKGITVDRNDVDKIASAVRRSHEVEISRGN